MGNRKAEDLLRHQEAERLRQKQELDARERQVERQIREKKEMRERELKQQEAEQQRCDDIMQKMMEQSAKTREADQAREDRMRRANDDNLRQVIADGNAELDRQQTSNLLEMTNKQKDHKDLMNREQNRLAELEKTIGEDVAAAKQQKADTQEKLYEEKRYYDDKKLEKFEEYAQKLEILHEEVAKIELDKERNTLEHIERMNTTKKCIGLGKNQVIMATEKDITEDQFIVAVNNTRQAGNDLAQDMSAMGSSAYSLRNGKSASDKNVARNIKSCREMSDRLRMRLNSLREVAGIIRNQRESLNKQTLKCQEIAEEIVNDVPCVDNALSEFSASLDEEIMCDTVDLFKQLQSNLSNLLKKVNSLPPVTKSNHTMEALKESSRFIAMSARGGNHPLIEELKTVHQEQPEIEYK